MSINVTKTQYKEIIKNLPKLKTLENQLNVPQWVLDVMSSYNYMAKVSNKIYRDCFVTYNINQSHEALSYVLFTEKVLNYQLPTMVKLLEKFCEVSAGGYAVCNQLRSELKPAIVLDLAYVKKLQAQSLKFCGITYIADKNTEIVPSLTSEHIESFGVPLKDVQASPSGVAPDCHDVQ